MFSYDLHDFVELKTKFSAVYCERLVHMTVSWDFRCFNIKQNLVSLVPINCRKLITTIYHDKYYNCNYDMSDKKA